MKISNNRKTTFAKVGAQMQNVQWAWCGVNHVTKTVFFNAWEKLNTSKMSWIILDKNWRGQNDHNLPGMKDALAKIDLVLNEGYNFGFFLAVNKGEPITLENYKTFGTAEIDYIKGSFYFEANLVEQDNFVIAEVVKRIDL